jgi:hypothetical protein
MATKEQKIYTQTECDNMKEAQWELGKNEGMNVGIFGGIVATLLVVIFIAVIIGCGDGYDGVDTEELGELICEDKGLEYDHREKNINVNVPKIYCKNKSDGLVLFDLDE